MSCSLGISIRVAANGGYSITAFKETDENKAVYVFSEANQVVKWAEEYIANTLNGDYSENLLKERIEKLELHPRVCKVLKLHGITTVKDILQYTEQRLNMFPTFGLKKVNEIKIALEKHGLQLAK